MASVIQLSSADVRQGVKEAESQASSVQFLDLKAAVAAAIPEEEARTELFVKLKGTRRMKELLEQAMEIADDPIPIFRKALEDIEWIL